MKALKIIAIIYISYYLLSIVVHWLKSSYWFGWLVNSIKYPLRKHRIDKLFKSLPEQQRRDMWLNATFTEDESKWYYRALEKHIRTKYIEPIVKQYGAV
jgi:hypothetical protein